MTQKPKDDGETFAPWSNDPDDPADCVPMTVAQSEAAALKVKEIFFPDYVAPKPKA